MEGNRPDPAGALNGALIDFSRAAASLQRANFRFETLSNSLATITGCPDEAMLSAVMADSELAAPLTTARLKHSAAEHALRAEIDRYALAHLPRQTLHSHADEDEALQSCIRAVDTFMSLQLPGMPSEE